MAWIVKIQLSTTDFADIEDAIKQAGYVVIALKENSETAYLIDSVNIVDILDD